MKLINADRFVAESKFVRLRRYRDADVVMCCVSTKEEAGAWWLLKTVLQDGKLPAVPRVDGDTMGFYIIGDLNELEPGKFGFFEPLQQCRIYLSGGAELMAVPGVRFDESCNRMGHGRGYYDKYFGKYGQECFFKVALTYGGPRRRGAFGQKASRHPYGCDPNGEAHNLARPLRCRKIK